MSKDLVPRKSRKATKATAPQALSVGAVVAVRTRQARADRGLTQAELVEWMETLGHRMLRSQLAKIELGRRASSVQELLALAVALDVSPSFLLTPPEGELLRVMDENTDSVLSEEETWKWFGGEMLNAGGNEPLLPAFIERQRREDELLVLADEIRARRALEGGAQA